MVKNISLAALLFATIGVIALCTIDLSGESLAQAEGHKLVITGSSTMAPLIAEIGKQFETRHPDIRVDIQTGGSSRGITDVMNGVADIGMASRALKSQEHQLHGSVIAHDGITIILHRSNPVQELTDDQIKAIYTGGITHWNQVGGPDAPITVVNKAEGRSTLELFLDYFQISNRDIHAHVVIGDNEQGIKTVAGNPHAIGYVSIGTAQYDATHGIPIRLLPLHHIPATIETVREGTFPLSRPLTLVTKSLPTGLIKTFIDFARSSQANDLILKQYFVPLQR
ncbi:phosphate ABC transporter substrate-binding protein [Candidatus Nitrospira allomarina]|uniref:Phosphate ABC transporter substrate-binding protein n=1 Tax=Candidatus Nitrospira allomarina TaxID=3020900 RepID=A0AA96GD17_9BACT|nr:phosphate ABC transporter substrate-binding protein [Candidatus Nitrospira allomarina]WNM56703.1 phosphate ABC transporter substrate-binding protein [Candidatus Nitrospira allomarina]